MNEISWIEWVGYIAVGLTVVSVLVYFIQRYFIFHPEKLPRNFQFHYDRPFREWNLQPEKGARLNGLHFTVENPKGVILYFHGNTRSVKGWAKFAVDFTKHGYDLVMFDYRGFGKSFGKRTEENMLKDSNFIYQKLMEKFPEDHLIVYGRSFGSAFAVKVASLNHPRFCILDSPFSSLVMASKRYLPFLPIANLLRYPLRSDLWMEYVRCHTYILHGTKDRIIPIRNSEQLTDIAPQRITLIRIEGGGHNNLPSFPQYHSFLRDILKY
jgi:hypothetical protein